MTEKNPVGRPAKYKPEFARMAYEACRLTGAIDTDLCAIFDVSEPTLNAWKKDYPEFIKSLREGKEIFDTNLVEASLRERATGYSHDDVHISNYQGTITQTAITKHYPPDATSAIFWLKNRDPDRWKDKQEVEHSGNMTIENIKRELFGDDK